MGGMVFRRMTPESPQGWVETQHESCLVSTWEYTVGYLLLGAVPPEMRGRETAPRPPKRRRQLLRLRFALQFRGLRLLQKPGGMSIIKGWRPDDPLRSDLMTMENSHTRPSENVAESAAAPVAEPVTIPTLSPVEPMVPRGPQPVRPLPVLATLMVSLIILLVLPYVAERVQYALTRGYQRARADVAKHLLAELPEAQSRFSYVAMKIEPSVVGIKTTRSVRRPNGGGRSFRRGFRGDEVEGMGSGVIVDEAGYVLTNYHVIAGATEVEVHLSDGRPVSGEVVGRDETTDLALLKIDAHGLTAASWGDSDELEVGDQVLAVGNPFGLDGTVTAGIISAKERPAATSMAHHDFLQTDAAVNPGNSGGPLVNLNGDIVGINTAIVGDTYRGISFAIPSRLAREVYDRLRETGHVDRGFLGVGMEAVSAELAENLGLDETKGAVVTWVQPDSPAERAGLAVDDVIVRWNDQAIDRIRDLGRAVVRTKIGSQATIEVIREGETLEFTVTVGDWSR